MLNKRHQNFINNIQTNNKIIKSGKSKQNLLKTKDVLAIFDDESDDLFITQDPEFLEQKKLFKEIEENKTITRNTQKNYLSKLVNKKKVKLTKENSFIDEKSPKNYTNNLNNTNSINKSINANNVNSFTTTRVSSAYPLLGKGNSSANIKNTSNIIEESKNDTSPLKRVASSKSGKIDLKYIIIY